MTDLPFTKVPRVFEKINCGRQTDLGPMIFQTAEIGNANIVFDGVEGWEDSGILTEDSIPDESDIEYFDGEAGSPAIIRGILKISHNKELAVSLKAPTDIAISLAENAPTVYTPVSPANATAVVAAPAPAYNEDSTVTFSVTATEGANFPVGKKVTIEVSDATYGTWLERVRVLKQDTDELTVEHLSQLPITAAAVTEVESASWAESSDDFETTKKYRFVQYQRPGVSGDGKMEIIAGGACQFRKGTVTLNKFEAKTVTLNLVHKADRNETDDRFDFKDRVIIHDR